MYLVIVLGGILLPLMRPATTKVEKHGGGDWLWVRVESSVGDGLWVRVGSSVGDGLWVRFASPVGDGLLVRVGSSVGDGLWGVRW